MAGDTVFIEAIGGQGEGRDTALLSQGSRPGQGTAAVLLDVFGDVFGDTDLLEQNGNQQDLPKSFLGKNFGGHSIYRSHSSECIHSCLHKTCVPAVDKMQYLHRS